MYLPSLNLFLTTWLLTSFAGPLQSEPQRSYATYYDPYQAQGSARDQYYLERPSGELTERSYRSSGSIPTQSATTPTPLLYTYQQLPNKNSPVPFNPYKPPGVPARTNVPKSIHGNKQINQVASNSYELRDIDSYENEKEYAEENEVLYQQFEQLSEDGGSRSDEILEKMMILAKALEDSNENDIETKNTLDDRILFSGMPEETKRVVRQVRKQKPGFFWTLARVTFETFNDTRSAIKQIGEILSNNIVPDSTTQRGPPTTTQSADDQSKLSSNVKSVDATTSTPVETTTESYKFSPGLIQSLIRRNLKGLVRLFNIEWKDALADSETSVKEFRKDLGNQIGLYLQ